MSSFDIKLSDLEYFSKIHAVKPSSSVRAAAFTIQIGQFRHLVVLDKDGSLKGIISIKDIVKKISNIIRSKNL